MEKEKRVRSERDTINYTRLLLVFTTSFCSRAWDYRIWYIEMRSTNNKGCQYLYEKRMYLHEKKRMNKGWLRDAYKLYPAYIFLLETCSYIYLFLPEICSYLYRNKFLSLIRHHHVSHELLIHAQITFIAIFCT